VWIKLKEDLHPMDLFGVHSVGSISADKIYKVVDSNEQCYSVLDDNGRYIQLHKSYFVENPTIDLCNTENVNYTHAICKDNETVQHKLTYGGIYEIVESNDSMIKIVDDNDEYSWFAIARFELVTPRPQIYKLGAIAEPLEPLPQNIYHITYSLQYAEGVELVDIDKANVIQIEGEIVSKGRVWVIETNKGTVIIPFKAIIHMHPQY
jgi:hypothetical protein